MENVEITINDNDTKTVHMYFAIIQMKVKIGHIVKLISMLITKKFLTKH